VFRFFHAGILKQLQDQRITMDIQLRVLLSKPFNHDAPYSQQSRGPVHNSQLVESAVI
jgi:hypothetical protein